jgi:trans-2,3-dihydro-3-hydroxyanthranilate isomerase
VAELDLLRIDVFTDELFMGNPASVVLDADAIDEVQMQRIASEAGLSDTAFVLKSKRADVRLRYFTPYGEDPLCGHATIGALWSLAEGKAFGGIYGGRHRVETPVGVLPFSLEGDSDEGLKRVWMTQKRPMFAREGDVKEVASALGIGVESLFHEEFPLSRTSTGLPCLLVPVKSLDIMKRLEPRRDEILSLSKELDVACIEVYSWGVLDKDSTVHARSFVPSQGALEDPASGMAAGALGAYLVENEFIPRDKFEGIVVEQGHWIGRPSRIHVRVEKHRDSIRKVEVGGSARVSFRARLLVP